MSKKALLAVMMAMILLLSGCALVVKDEAVDNATEIIRMGDQVVTKERVKEETRNELDSMAYMYSMYGYSYDTTDPDNIAAAQEAAVEALKKDLVLTAKAKELGLDQLTDEEKETAEKNAQTSYDSSLLYVKNYMLTDTEGKSEEELTQAAADKLTELKVSLETYVESETKTIIDDKLRAHIVDGIDATEEEIQADFDSKVESQKEKYAEDAGTWADDANNGTTMYYVPAGIRRVKQILIKFHEEDSTAISDAKNLVTDANTAVSAAQAKISSAQETLDIEGDTDEIKAAKEQAQADKDAAQKELEEAQKALEDANKAVEDATNKAFENIDAETDEVLASVKAEGADWQVIMDEKNQDTGMKSNTKGYAVNENMKNFDSAFVEAAMALAKPGDISDKVKGTSYGYYIIRYDSDEQEGAIDINEVKESIHSSLRTTKQNEAYNSTVEKWVEEAGLKVDLNALKD